MAAFTAIYLSHFDRIDFDAIRMHHYQQDLANMFVSNVPQPFITGNMGNMSSWSQQGGGPSMQIQLSLGPAPSFSLVPRDLAP